ncbi:saccharopine dehydrogenase NADP-binding domain-containing protein [Hoeflea alexandrii]|uniref:saccharopine dehydrogenase NADP-binding domain-containing protein n=1 Tax=Hoeflea alexandrii TaxID=288436 RepID=UPI00226FD120|nr:saccharopine dehydrogenase NADP-binding domain-containing protein [Hoeflea alexandrii]MCY0152146.1 saccharopine dehydrogenase NADP-binding domain-containing protein [Hoeflea alexandrii]
MPSFDDHGLATVMDGECVLCSVGARLIARFDKAGEFRICRSQTPLGRALLHHYGLSADDPESWLYIADGQAFTSLDAMIRAEPAGWRSWSAAATAATDAPQPARLALPAARTQQVSVVWTQQHVRNSGSGAAGKAHGMKVVVLGGYGVFGSRLAELLVRDGHDVVVAGRSLSKAQALSGRLGCKALAVDVRREPDALFAGSPDVVVDAVGPFQTYGHDPYVIPRLCIEHGADYLDLSDDAAFTA